MSFDTMSFEIGKNRIEALSDGIFAIVMTLLILEIHVPNLPSNAPNVEVAPALVALLPKFASYIVTFVSLGCFWVGHHIMYHAIQRAECLFRSFYRAALLRNQPGDYRLDVVLSMALCKLATGDAGCFCQCRIPQHGTIPHVDSPGGDNADRVHLFLERGD
jgi:hypothetical protein